MNDKNELTLRSIVGLVESADAALDKIIRDCISRPADQTPRTIGIKIEIVPNSRAGRNGMLIMPDFKFTVESGIRERDSDSCRLMITAAGNHYIATLVSSADDPGQMTIDDVRED